MKKTTLILLAIFFLAAAAFSPLRPAGAKNNATPGSLIKGKGNPTIYYLGEDGKRYVFPNAKTFFSWYENFDGVTEINLADLSDLPLGGNVTYKPGAILVKVQTDPKVYAVGLNGLLRWIGTEALAKKLYGANWNKLIDDLPDSFFTNYSVGDPIDDEESYDPEEEEDQAPTISHNKGFKQKIKVQARHMVQAQKRCRWMEHAINRLQKRAQLWGIEIGNIGEDFMTDCVADNSGADSVKNEKITLCHIPPGDPASAETITVGKASATAHLAHGDALGECAANDDSSDDGSDEADTTAPVISGISTAVTTTSATVSWETDEASNGTVEYAAESLSGSTSTDSVSAADLTTSHSIVIENLDPETTYYFVVKSADAAANTASSEEATFTTEEEAQVDVTDPVISGITVSTGTTTATIGWTTDEPATSKITYADESLATASTTAEHNDDTLVTAHELELTGLDSLTQYFFNIESSDASVNTAVSDEQNFSTL